MIFRLLYATSRFLRFTCSLMCLAYCSQTYNYVQPRLCTDSVIEIHQGRY